jgi:autotransporter family porin
MRRLGLIGLVVGVVVLVLGVFASAAPTAAKNDRCMVINDRLNTTYHWSKQDGQPVQTAIDAADPGDTLWIRNVCPGPITITKSLTLTGQEIPGFYFTPTIMNDYNAETSVAHVSGSDVQVQLNTLTLTGGGRDYLHPAEHGGGIWNEQATLTLDNVTITENWAKQGGGIYNDHGTVELTNSTIDTNMLSRTSDLPRYGGGIYTDGGTITLNASKITNNLLAYYGGGIYAIAATVVANGSEIAYNHAGGTAGVERGGGIYTTYTGSYPNYIGSTVTLTDTKIHDSTATHGGGIYAGPDGTLTLTGTSELTANHAGSDGGGAFASSTVIVSGDAKIYDNSAGRDGGGVYTFDNVTLSENAQIYDNTSGYDGGGVYVDGYHSYFTMTGNAKIYGNHAFHQGGGIYKWSYSYLTNCIPGAEEDGANVFDNAPNDIYPYP